MDLTKNGRFLYTLRKEKGLTQKALAEKLGVVAKTVSKWETGKGFPDVSTLSMLSDVLGVSERSLLAGQVVKNKVETGNIRLTKFYVCDCCGSFFQGMGKAQITCCGKVVEPLKPKQIDNAHNLTISPIEDELYLKFEHPMSKEHYISFVTYIGIDRILTVRLYPEQESAIRLPKVYSGKLLFYCNSHGLYEYKIQPHKKS